MYVRKDTKPFCVHCDKNLVYVHCTVSYLDKLKPPQVGTMKNHYILLHCWLNNYLFLEDISYVYHTKRYTDNSRAVVREAHLEDLNCYRNRRKRHFRNHL